MLKVAVIADDLTGAGDTGVQFLRAAAPIYLAAASDLNRPAFPKPPAGLSVYTDSRSLGPVEAAERARTAAEKLIPFSPQLIYKKMDSCLRGNIGAEADAVLDRFDLPVGFLMPALPGQGRTTVHDVHRVHGTPVADTEMANDPVTPVIESRLSVLMAEQSRNPVGRIDIAEYAHGTAYVSDRISRLIADGCRHIAFDAQTAEHLDIVARLARTRFPDALLIGSAGLGGALSSLMAGDEDQSPTLTRPAGPGILFVAGSASRITRDQVDDMIRAFSPESVLLNPAVLIDPDQAEERRRIAKITSEQLNRGPMVWRLADPLPNGIHPPKSVLGGLSELTGRLLERRIPDGLVLTGGDTARAVLQVSGASEFELQGEILPGLVWGAAAGGRLAGRTIVTKAGAFGRPEAFTELYSILIQGKETQ